MGTKTEDLSDVTANRAETGGIQFDIVFVQVRQNKDSSAW